MSVVRTASLHDQMASMSLAPRRRRRVLPGVPASTATSMEAEITQVTDSLQLISVVRAERSLAQAFDEATIVHMLSYSSIRDLGAAACACRRLSYVTISFELHWRDAAQRLGINVARLQRRRKTRYFWRNMCRQEILKVKRRSANALCDIAPPAGIA